jgi:hypothetical protein
MILFLQPIGSSDRQWYKIMDFEDLNPVFDTFPMTREIAMTCDTLGEAVDAISEYLSSHSMTSWIEDQDLSKSLRTKALALGLSLSTALSPDGHKLPKPSMQPTMPKQVKIQPPASDFGSHPMDRFLWNVAQIESSGGKNTHHKPIASGKYRGNKAIGKWGLLKPTVDELVGRMRVSGKLTPEYQNLDMMSRDKLEEHFKKNPQIELGLARQLAQHIMQRQKNNPERAAYSWLHGHNLHPADIPRDKLLHSEYVGKYKQLDKMNPFLARRRPSAVKKSMPEIDSEDFKMRVKNWYKRREDELTEDPTRTSSFQPDPGRMRNDDLDLIKPDSMKRPSEILTDNIKRANENRR